jgi:hypothetical protein
MSSRLTQQHAITHDSTHVGPTNAILVPFIPLCFNPPGSQDMAGAAGGGEGMVVVRSSATATA